MPVGITQKVKDSLYTMGSLRIFWPSLRNKIIYYFLSKFRGFFSADKEIYSNYKP